MGAVAEADLRDQLVAVLWDDDLVTTTPVLGGQGRCLTVAGVVDG